VQEGKPTMQEARRSFGRGLSRAIAVMGAFLLLAGCDTLGSVLPTPDTAAPKRPPRVGVVSLFGDEFLSVELQYLSQYQSATSKVPRWALDDYITRVTGDAITAAGGEFVDMRYDRQALARGYSTAQPFSEIQSALVGTFSLGLSESPVRYFDVDAIEKDLRPLCRIKALDQLLLITRGRHKILAGVGLIRSEAGDDTRAFAILDLTVFDCPGPRETDWDNVRNAQKVDGSLWAKSVDKLTPEHRKTLESDIKALLAKSLRQAMTETDAVQQSVAGGAGPLLAESVPW
jgi:hypothetical protein